MTTPSTSNDNTRETTGSVLLCHSANDITRQFHLELSSLEPEGAVRNDFLKRSFEGGNETLKLLCLMEIGKSRNKEWLEWLFARSKSESRPTILASLYGAIAQLGGFTEAGDYEQLFQSPDISRRSAAFHVLEFIPREDAIRILCNIMTHDVEVSLRREAAVRLAYLESNEGLRELLKLVDEGEYYEQVRAACALCALGHNVGLTYIDELTRRESELSVAQRTELMFTVHHLLSHASVEFERFDVQPETAVRTILRKASEWIEEHAAERDVGAKNIE
jgi:hypothetical protein